jgi:hypothetical protein
MDRILGYLKTIKFWAGVVGAGLTAAGGIVGAPVWLLAIGSVLTGIALWELPYQPYKQPVDTQ